jgi:hypothetical protein
MANYADYTFYTDDYLGTAIAEADFPALALRATAVIDAITFGRAATDTPCARLRKNYNDKPKPEALTRSRANHRAATQ